MLWFKRLITGIFSLFLVASLFGLAMSISLNSAFSSPNHLKTWAQNSNFYDSFLAKASSDTAVSLGNPTLYKQLDPVVRQSLKTVLPETQFNQYINTVIDANYSWLKGKSATPNFIIDITKQKLAFADSLGTYVQKRYQTLPKCTALEVANLTSTNPLTLTCQIPTISSISVKNEVVSEVESSSIVVKDTVITADSLKHNNRPYYTAYNLPAAYSHLRAAPIYMGVIALICVAFIALIGRRRFKFLTTLAICFAITGLALVLMSSASSKIDNKINAHIPKNSSIASFTTPIDNLIHKAVNYVNGINLWIGLAYLLICFILVILYLWLKQRSPKKPLISPEVEQTNSESRPKHDNFSTPRPAHVTKQPSAPVLKPKSNKNKLIQ